MVEEEEAAISADKNDNDDNVHSAIAHISTPGEPPVTPQGKNVHGGASIHEEPQISALVTPPPPPPQRQISGGILSIFVSSEALIEAINNMEQTEISPMNSPSLSASSETIEQALPLKFLMLDVHLVDLADKVAMLVKKMDDINVKLAETLADHLAKKVEINSEQVDDMAKKQNTHQPNQQAKPIQPLFCHLED